MYFTYYKAVLWIYTHKGNEHIMPYIIDKRVQYVEEEGILDLYRNRDCCAGAIFDCRYDGANADLSEAILLVRAWAEVLFDVLKQTFPGLEQQPCVGFCESLDSLRHVMGVRVWVLHSSDFARCPFSQMLRVLVSLFQVIEVMIELGELLCRKGHPGETLKVLGYENVVKIAFIRRVSCDCSRWVGSHTAEFQYCLDTLGACWEDGLALVPQFCIAAEHLKRQVGELATLLHAHESP